MKRKMREAAIRNNEVATFKCGPYEILKVAYEAHMAVVRHNQESQFIVAGLRCIVLAFADNFMMVYSL